MALTRAQVETILTTRVGKKLTMVSLDGTTKDGTNRDLDDALRAGLAALGITPATLAATDADFTRVADADWPQLLDIAELRCLETILGNIDEPDASHNTNKQEWGRLSRYILLVIEQKRDWIQKTYGFGRAALSIGSISLDFNEPMPPGGFGSVGL